MARFFNAFRKQLLGKGKVKNYLLYAIGEIILVVIGILIALQINNWNEKQIKKKEELRILKNLERDINKDLVQLGQIMASTQVRMQQIDSIFIFLQNPDTAPIDDMIRLNEGIRRGDLFELNSGTYDESLASGKINYIQNDSIREAIFEYYRTINENLTQKNSYKFLLEHILPEWGAIVIPSQEAMSFLGLKTNMPPLDLKALVNNKKYNTVLAQAYGNYGTLLVLWLNYSKRADLLKNKVSKELNRLKKS